MTHCSLLKSYDVVEIAHLILAVANKLCDLIHTRALNPAQHKQQTVGVLGLKSHKSGCGIFISVFLDWVSECIVEISVSTIRLIYMIDI